MSLSQDQLTDRQHAITASDVAAILGLSPFKSPLDVWLQHTGLAPPFVGNARTTWGDLLEPVIRADYESRHGVQVTQCGTLRCHRDEVTIAATPDGLVSPCSDDVFERAPPTHGLEIKTHSLFAADYGPEGSDQVPIHVALQCQIGMYVAALSRWDVVAFYDGLPHEYVLKRDDETINTTIGYCLRWWQDHVVAHKAPDPDGSRATELAIRRMLPGQWRELKEARYLEPTEEQMQALTTLRRARADVAHMKRLESHARQRLELAIGEADGLAWSGEDGKVAKLSWRRSQDSSSIDYKAALIDYQGQLALIVSADGDIGDLDATIKRGPDLARFTTTKPGPRRFVVPRSWSRDLPPGEDGGDE